MLSGLLILLQILLLVVMPPPAAQPAECFEFSYGEWDADLMPVFAERYMVMIPEGRVWEVPLKQPEGDSLPWGFDAGRRVRLVEPGSDGRYAAYVTEAYEGSERFNAVYIQDTRSGIIHRLLEGYRAHAAWSGDGRLAYVWQPDADQDFAPDEETVYLSVFDPASGDTRTAGLFSMPFRNQYEGWLVAGWSGNRQYIAVIQNPGYYDLPIEAHKGSRVYILRADDLTPVDLELPAFDVPEPAVTFVWSPGGSRFAYRTPDSLLIGTPETGIEQTISLKPVDYYEYRPAPDWSPDGRYLMVSTFDEPDNLWRYDLFGTDGTAIRDISGADQRGFGLGFPDYVFNHWLDDSTGWLFIGHDDGGYTLTSLAVPEGSTEVLVSGVAIDLSGMRIDRVAGAYMGTLPSGNGLLAVATVEHDRYAVQVIPETGGEPVFLVEDAPQVDDVVWSSDGNYLAATIALGEDHDAPRRTVWMRADGTGRGSLDFDSGQITTWMEDRNTFLLVSRTGDEFTARIVDAETGAVTTLLTKAEYPGAPYGYWNAEWSLIPSPDGQHLLLNFDQPYPIWWEGLYLTTWDGEPAQPLPGVSPEWSPGGAWLSYLAMSGDFQNPDYTLTVIDTDGSPVWSLPLDAEKSLLDTGWSPCPDVN